MVCKETKVTPELNCVYFCFCFYLFIFFFQVEGFPTIYFSPAGNKEAEPIKYDGGRTAEAMEEYLRKNAKKAFKKTEL